MKYRFADKARRLTAGRARDRAATSLCDPRDVAPEPANLISIQYLRGIAALQVVIVHASHVAGANYHLGSFGVPLFFMISGFLMVLITRNGASPGSFMTRRIVRVVPLYWIATTAMVITLLARSPADPRHVIASYLFLPRKMPGADEHFFPILDVGWTLNYEIFFYALFALSLLLPGRGQRVALVVAFIALFLAGMIFQPSFTAGAFYTNPVILLFLAGAGLGWWWSDGRQSFLWPMLACVMTGMLFVAVVLLIGPNQLSKAAWFGCLAGAIFLTALWFERKGVFGKPVRLLRLLGDASYSIYLWHPIAIVILGLVLRRIAVPHWTLFPLNLAFGTICGLMAFVVLERPLLKMLSASRSRNLPGTAADRRSGTLPSPDR